MESDLTFDGPRRRCSLNPLADWEEPILAPFFADVDTRNPGPRTWSPTAPPPDGTHFCVNWVNVGYYEEHVEKRISAQLVVTRRNDVSPGAVDLTYNYGSIQWETGDASDGSYGIGGKPVRVGYATGEGTVLELAGSGQTGAFMDGGPHALVSGSRGSSTPGRTLSKCAEPAGDASARTGRAR